MNRLQEHPVPPRALRVERIPADLVETAAGWLVVLALPGVPEADIDVQVERGALKVAATRASTVPDNARGARVLRRGPAPARLEREFLLPDGVGPDAVTAALEGGLLRVEIARPAIEKKTVPIRTA